MLCQTRQDYFELWEKGGGPCLPGSTQKNCEWQFSGGNLYICSLCGGRWNGKKPKPRICSSSIPKRTPQRIGMDAVARGCCGGPIQPPTPLPVRKPAVLSRAISFTKSMIEWSLEGFPLTSESRRESRHLACSQCKLKDGDWCGGCGCYLPVAEKIETKHCPIALWPGDGDKWTPQVHADWLKKVAVIMPVCGNEEFTANAVADCKREGVHVIVVDGCTSGWLRGTNQGLSQALADERFDFFVLLNNDVRLSRGFFAGLLVAYVQTGGDMITACYNVGWAPQKPTHQDQPSADEYKPRPLHRQVPLADGTCVMVTRRLLETCGLLDAEHFGKYGHAATGDLAIRAKQRGMTIQATEAAYCYHYGMQTANVIHGNDYMDKAQREAREGLIAKWGDRFDSLQSALRLLPPRSTGIETRNVVYHVYPSQVGEWNVVRMLRHIDLFNGKRIACVVESDYDAGRILELLRKHGFTILFRKNDPDLWDSVAFIDMLDMVKNDSPTEATFVGHTKGAGRMRNDAWAEHMYAHCLGRADEMMESLKDYACAGSLIQLRFPNPPNFKHNVDWHYAGSFYWLRHDATFSREWRIVARDRYFIEAFPGLLFESHEAFNLGPTKTDSPWH